MNKRVTSLLGGVLAVITACGAVRGYNKPLKDDNMQAVQAEEAPELYYTGIEEYRVKAFDTLSDIAVNYIPSDTYMQQWIDDVKVLNNRKSSTIYFDEVIKVYVCD